MPFAYSLNNRHGFERVERVERAERELAEGGGELVDAGLPGGEIDVEVVGDDLEGDVGLAEVLGDGVERGRLHIEAVGLLRQPLQELGRIDVRRDETVGGEELAVGGFGRVDGQTVEEHRVVEESSAAGDDLGDANQRPHGGGVRPGSADVHDGEIFVLMLLHEPQHGVRGVLAADTAEVHFFFDVEDFLLNGGE